MSSVNTIIALITSNTQRGGATRLVVDPALDSGSGLLAISAVACESLFSLHQRLIVKRIGSLSSEAIAQVDHCLKIALGWPEFITGEKKLIRIADEERASVAR